MQVSILLVVTQSFCCNSIMIVIDIKVTGFIDYSTTKEAWR